MKLRSLFEEEGLSPKELAEKVKKDCKPFLSEGIDEHHLLLRGIVNKGSRNTMYGVEKTHADRRLRNTSKELSDAVDDAFLNKFGIKFRTDRVLFCTGGSDIAEEYGDVHTVFPIGKFDYCWSPKVTDLYSDFEIIGMKDPKEKLDFLADNGIFVAGEEAVADAVAGFRDTYYTEIADSIIDGTLKYRMNTGLRKATEESAEIMVRCDEYYTVRLYTEYVEEFLEEMFK